MIVTSKWDKATLVNIFKDSQLFVFQVISNFQAKWGKMVTYFKKEEIALESFDYYKIQ